MQVIDEAWTTYTMAQTDDFTGKENRKVLGHNIKMYNKINKKNIQNLSLYQSPMVHAGSDTLKLCKTAQMSSLIN